MSEADICTSVLKYWRFRNGDFADPNWLLAGFLSDKIM